MLSEPIDPSKWVPIFPLPNAVLMPKAILPLHVFEERYREMTRDALAGHKRIAVALLKPGYESRYFSLDAEIHSEVCVGRILRDEELPDGRFNLLVQGLCRARVIDENKALAYRRGRLMPTPANAAPPGAECALRRRIRGLLTAPTLADLTKKANWLDVLHCPDFSLSDVIDVLASAVLPSIEEKQQFLAEPCVVARGAYLCDVLGAVLSGVERSAQQAGRPKSWPPRTIDN